MRVLITGASGLLGRYLLGSRPPNVALIGWCGTPTSVGSHAALTPVDLSGPRQVEGAFRLTRPDVVIHLAAWSNVGDCLRDPDGARRINTTATGQLAALAKDTGARFLFASTDLVFDGTAGPYAEDAPTQPLSVYGQTKAAAEELVLANGGTVVRLPLLYGPGREGRTSFFDTLLAGLRAGQALTLFHDEHRTPLDLVSAATIFWALCERPVQGIIHAGGAERLSRLEMGQRLARWFKLSTDGIRAVSRTDVSGQETRPADTSLRSTRLTHLLPALPRPTFEQALAGMFQANSSG